MVYQRTTVDQIQQAIKQFSLEESFTNLNTNEMVFLLNKTIKNIFSNYIPHETITCGDRDPPWLTTFFQTTFPWNNHLWWQRSTLINNNIKRLNQEKNYTYRSYILNDKNPQIFHKVKYIQNQLKRSQEKYYLHVSKKLIDPMTRP